MAVISPILRKSTVSAAQTVDLCKIAALLSGLTEG
jgi:hypothetical protein